MFVCDICRAPYTDKSGSEQPRQQERFLLFICLFDSADRTKRFFKPIINNFFLLSSQMKRAESQRNMTQLSENYLTEFFEKMSSVQVLIDVKKI